MRRIVLLSVAVGVIFSFTGCRTVAKDPDRDYAPESGVSRKAYRIVRRLKSRVFIRSVGYKPAGWQRVNKVERANRSVYVENGRREHVVVTLQRTGLFGGLLGWESGKQQHSYLTLRSDAEAADFYIHVMGEASPFLKEGELSYEYKQFWRKPLMVVKPTDISK